MAILATLATMAISFLNAAILATLDILSSMVTFPNCGYSG